MTWTVQRVKDELPDVEVQSKDYQGKPITTKCRVHGRMNKFATVRPFYLGSAKFWEYSWQTICDCLNSDRPLRV